MEIVSFIPLERIQHLPQQYNYLHRISVDGVCTFSLRTKFFITTYLRIYEATNEDNSVFIPVSKIHHGNDKSRLINMCWML